MSPRPRHDPVPTAQPSQADVERLRAAELALVERLAASGFAGAEFEAFAYRLVGSGIRVIDAWTITRHIFVECARKGIHLGDPLDWSNDERATLVQDSVHTGFRRFRTHALGERKWNAQRGASLSTYFIGNCVYAFADEYRDWRDAELARRLQRQDLVLHMGTLPAPSLQRVGAAVIDRITALQALREIARQDPRLARILALDAEGYEHEQIAAILADGTSARAVEGVLRRHRRRQGGCR